MQDAKIYVAANAINFFTRLAYAAALDLVIKQFAIAAVWVGSGDLTQLPGV